jgi:hypothetical protein
MKSDFQLRKVSMELRKVYDDYFFTNLVKDKIYRISKEEYDLIIQILNELSDIPFNPISDITELVKQKQYGITQE